jgi:hypothetical protein
MNQIARAKAFEDNTPTFFEDEANAAHDGAQIVTSFAARPRLGRTMPDHIAYIGLKLALYDGYNLTVLLDRFSAEALHNTVHRVKNLNWRGDSLKPSDVPH